MGAAQGCRKLQPWAAISQRLRRLILAHVADDVAHRVFRLLHPIGVVFEVRGAPAPDVYDRSEKWV